MDYMKLKFIEWLKLKHKTFARLSVLHTITYVYQVVQQFLCDWDLKIKINL